MAILGFANKIPLPRMSEYLLDDFITPMGLKAEDVSKGSEISLYDVRAIFADAQDITPDMSQKLGTYFRSIGHVIL